MNRKVRTKLPATQMPSPASNSSDQGHPDPSTTETPAQSRLDASPLPSDVAPTRSSPEYVPSPVIGERVYSADSFRLRSSSVLSQARTQMPAPLASVAPAPAATRKRPLTSPPAHVSTRSGSPDQSPPTRKRRLRSPPSISLWSIGESVLGSPGYSRFSSGGGLDRGSRH